MDRFIRAAAAALVATALLGACSATPPEPTPRTSVGASTSATDATALLARHNLSGLSAQAVVETLDADPRARPLPLKASVRSGELILSDDQGEATLPLSSDQFYLSIAPYLTHTHDCYFHNLGTCQGELAGKAVHVKVTDSDGTVLVDQDATTYANGFVAFWVPKGRTGTIEVTADGKSGQVPFDSGTEGATCVTTLKLT